MDINFATSILDSEATTSVYASEKSFDDWFGNLANVWGEAVNQHGQAHRGTDVLIPLDREVIVLPFKEANIVQWLDINIKLDGKRNEGIVDVLQPQNVAHDRDCLLVLRVVLLELAKLLKDYHSYDVYQGE